MGPPLALGCEQCVLVDDGVQIPGVQVFSIAENCDIQADYYPSNFFDESNIISFELDDDDDDDGGNNSEDDSGNTNTTSGGSSDDPDVILIAIPVVIVLLLIVGVVVYRSRTRNNQVTQVE